MAPRTDAVSFVNHEASELLATIEILKQVAKRVALDNLRSLAHQLHSTSPKRENETHLLWSDIRQARRRRIAPHRRHRKLPVRRRHLRVEEDDGDVLLLQTLALIRDQAQQRADDDRDALGRPALHDRRKLEAQTLPSAGGEKDKDVLPAQSSVDRFLLVRAEAREEEPLSKSLGDVARPGMRELGGRGDARGVDRGVGFGGGGFGSGSGFGRRWGRGALGGGRGAFSGRRSGERSGALGGRTLSCRRGLLGRWRALGLLSSWGRLRRTLRRQRTSDLLRLDNDDILLRLLLDLHPAGLGRREVVVEIDSRTKVLRVDLDRSSLALAAHDDWSPPLLDRLDDWRSPLLLRLDNDRVGRDIVRRVVIARGFRGDLLERRWSVTGRPCAGLRVRRGWSGAGGGDGSF